MAYGRAMHRAVRKHEDRIERARWVHLGRGVWVVKEYLKDEAFRTALRRCATGEAE